MVIQPSWAGISGASPRVSRSLGADPGVLSQPQALWGSVKRKLGVELAFPLRGFPRVIPLRGFPRVMRIDDPTPQNNGEERL